ncbi:hypothetical protein AXG93_4620s2040 [Marchantia polymorpha subsp. ruderalis]|uniref:Uncharacterized protein n=1 Tax=Marchantia polymorpha subsp. ruderalis TaxID=1480154 RepID=A0A176VX41_MARPO|nr:hypothetical protein AXG93_4620s2040 [Marchantia polymorpha subsp. ruderalis]
MQTFVVVDVYLPMFTLYTTTLDLSKPLALLEPSHRQLDSTATNNVTYRACEQLQECTHVVAAQIVASRPAPGFVPAETHSQPTKRTRLKTKSIIAATLGKSNSSNGAQDLRNCSGVALTAEQIVSSEMENIKKMEQLNEDEWSALADLCFW